MSMAVQNINTKTPSHKAKGKKEGRGRQGDYAIGRGVAGRPVGPSPSPSLFLTLIFTAAIACLNFLAGNPCCIILINGSGNRATHFTVRRRGFK